MNNSMSKSKSKKSWQESIGIYNYDYKRQQNFDSSPKFQIRIIKNRCGWYLSILINELSLYDVLEATLAALPWLPVYVACEGFW